MAVSKGRQCCGFFPIKTGVILITIFGILNKLSGFYGILSLDYSDSFATFNYIYSVLTTIIFGYALHGLFNNNVRIIRWYTMMYWVDCFFSVFSTAWNSDEWFNHTDHSLPDLEDSPEKLLEHDRIFKMESQISIFVLIGLRIVHFYFAYIVTSYYKSINKGVYSKLATENIDLESNSIEKTEALAKSAKD